MTKGAHTYSYFLFDLPEQLHYVLSVDLVVEQIDPRFPCVCAFETDYGIQLNEQDVMHAVVFTPGPEQNATLYKYIQWTDLQRQEMAAYELGQGGKGYGSGSDSVEDDMNVLNFVASSAGGSATAGAPHRPSGLGSPSG